MTDSYVCVDLETTGLNPKKDRIIEIGVVKVENNVVVEEWGTFVNPGRQLDERVVELTGIQDRQLEQAPSIDEALPRLLGLLDSPVLLGHSVIFDYSFIKKAAVRIHLRPSGPALHPGLLFPEEHAQDARVHRVRGKVFSGSPCQDRPGMVPEEKNTRRRSERAMPALEATGEMQLMLCLPFSFPSIL